METGFSEKEMLVTGTKRKFDKGEKAQIPDKLGIIIMFFVPTCGACTSNYKVTEIKY